MSIALHYKRKEDPISFQTDETSICNLTNNNSQQFRFMYEIPFKQLFTLNNSTSNLCKIMKDKLTSNVSVN